MFRNTFAMESIIYFYKWKRNIRPLVKRYQNFAILLGRQYLFETLHTSPTMKTSETVWKKVGVSAMERALFCLK